MSRNDRARAVDANGHANRSGVPPTGPAASASPPTPAILVVSDDGAQAGDLVARLEKHGYAASAVACAEVPNGAGERADPSPDLALVDLAPRGIEAAERLGNGGGVPVVYLTGEADREYLERARATRPFGYVVRPAGTAQLRLNIESALAAHAREREHRKTERRQERRIAAMRSHERLMDTVFDTVGEGVIVADHQGNYLVSNATARLIVGGDLPDVEMARRPAEFGFFRPDGKTPVPLEEMPLPRALQGEATDDVQIVVRNPSIPDGLRLSIDGRPVKLDDGTPGAVLVFRDITRAKKAERKVKIQMDELREQRNLLDTILDSMTEGVIVAGMDGKLIYANRSVRETIAEPDLKLPPSEWSEAYGLFHVDRETPINPEEMPIIRALQGKPTEQEEFYIRNDQTPPEGRFIHAHASPLFNADGNEVIGAVGVIQNITRYKRVEATLRKTLGEIEKHRDLMQTVFTSMSDGVVVADREGNFTMFNPAAEKIVGMGMLDIGPDEWTEKYGLFYPDKKTALPIEEVPLVRAINGKRTVEMEMFVRNERRPDGLHILANGEPLTPDDGGLAGGVVVFRDVTARRSGEAARRRALNELREQTELMETVFESISDGIVAVDKTGAVVQINSQALKVAKIDGEIAPSDTWARRYGIYYPDRVTRVKNENLPVMRAAFKGESVDEDMVLINESAPDGVTLHISARPLLDTDGSRRGGVAVFRDVTEVRQAEDALADAFAKGKIEIIDTVLHNIGNAVNSVTTGIETIDQTLRDDTLTDRLRMLADALEAHRGDWIGYIRDHPQGRLVLPFVVALAKDLLARDARMRKAARRALARSEHIAGIVRTQRIFKKQAGSKKAIQLRQSFAHAVSLVELPLSAAGVQVEIDCENAPEVIWTQENELQQTIVNLVKNSIDAITARGATAESGWTPRILIRAYTNEPNLMIEVEDNGIGIPSDKLDAIFSPGFTTKKKGTGLGLHSVANFVRRSSGLIWAVSKGVGHGAKIRMEMRLAVLGIGDDDGDDDDARSGADDARGGDGIGGGGDPNREWQRGRHDG